MNSDIDLLSLYFGEDYKINEFITVHNPTIGDVINKGEKDYFSVLSRLTAIPSDMKAMLWDNGICWMDISDFDFFCLISKSLSVKDTSVFLGDLDLSKMKDGIDETNQEHVLYQKADNGKYIIIDRGIYLRIVTVLRKIHNLKPKIEYASTKTLTKILIELNRSDIQSAANRPYNSSLLPLISTMTNMEGFKYNLNDIREMPYYAFIDSVKRISLIKSTNALLNGCYSGWIDGSKIDKKSLNWFKEFDSDK